MAELCKLLPRQFSSLEIEIIALENGILLAKEMELTQVIFESDVLTVKDLSDAQAIYIKAFVPSLSLLEAGRFFT